MSQTSAAENREMALDALYRLRVGTAMPPDDTISDLRSYLEGCGLYLYSIGSSEEEIAAIRRKWYKGAATRMLNILRAGNDHYFGPHLATLRQYLADGGLTLADISASESTISRLRCRNRRSLRKEKRLLKSL